MQVFIQMTPSLQVSVQHVVGNTCMFQSLKASINEYKNCVHATVARLIVELDCIDLSHASESNVINQSECEYMKMPLSLLIALTIDSNRKV